MMLKIRFLLSFLVITLLISGCNLLDAVQIDTETEIAPPVTQVIQVTETVMNDPVPTNTPVPTEETIIIPDSPIIDTASVSSLTGYIQLPFTNPIGAAWNLPDGNFSAFSSETLESYEIDSFSALDNAQFDASAQILDVASDGSKFAQTRDMATVEIIEMATSFLITTIDPGTMVNTARFSPDGERLLVTSMDEIIAMEYDLLSGALLDTYEGFGFAGPVYDALYANYTRDILWYSRGSVMVQNLENHAITPIFYHVEFINSLALSADGKTLAVSTAKTMNDSYEAGIQLWDRTDGTDLGFIQTQALSKDLVFTLDGKLLIGADMNDLCAWDPQTLDLVQSFSGHTDLISFVSLSPDNTRVLTGSFDNTIILWLIQP